MIEENLKANYLVSSVFFKSEFKTHAYAPKNVKKVVDLFLYGQKTMVKERINFQNRLLQIRFARAARFNKS